MGFKVNAHRCSGLHAPGDAAGREGDPLRGCMLYLYQWCSLLFRHGVFYYYYLSWL